MLEDLEYLKKWCQQDHTGLSGYGVARAVERIVDDLITKHAAQQQRAPDVLARCKKCNALIETTVHCDNCGTFEPTRR